jgi:hypothetical protein
VHEGWRQIRAAIDKAAKDHFEATCTMAPPTKKSSDLKIRRRDLLNRHMDLRQSWREGLEADHQEVTATLRDITAT